MFGVRVCFQIVLTVAALISRRSWLWWRRGLRLALRHSQRGKELAQHFLVHVHVMQRLLGKQFANFLNLLFGKWPTRNHSHVGWNYDFKVGRKVQLLTRFWSPHFNYMQCQSLLNRIILLLLLVVWGFQVLAVRASSIATRRLDRRHGARALGVAFCGFQQVGVVLRRLVWR
jgi:hypothetical protein